MIAKLRSLLQDEAGQGMTEYGLIIALIAVVVIVSLTAMGKNIKGIFDNAGTALTPPSSSN